MSQWPSTKARRVYSALLALGWQLKRQSGSHRTLCRDGWPDFAFAFHGGEATGTNRCTTSACHGDGLHCLLLGATRSSTGLYFALPWVRTLAFAAGFAGQVTLAWQVLSH